MHAAAVPAFAQSLTALSAILDKAQAWAAARKVEEATLLGLRLYPDMLPFVRQVQIAGDFAKNTLARLAGEEPVRFSDEEKTLAELKDRLARTLALVTAMPAERIDGSEDRTVTINVGGQPMSFRGQDYLINFALPNFYFHATTAYAILRHVGVDIGKRDFMGRV
jgi:hypothetical protein